RDLRPRRRRLDASSPPRGRGRRRAGAGHDRGGNPRGGAGDTMSTEPKGSGRELRIGDVAKLTGTTPRTIRYYQEIGLLPTAADREPGAHRTYEEGDVERLTELLRLKDLLGISLEELRELVSAEDAREALRREWRGGVEDPVRRRQILEESLGH